MKRLVFAVGVIALGVAALTPARRFRRDPFQGWPLPGVDGQQGGALVPRGEVSRGRSKELGLCHHARQVGDEAPPLQGLVLI